MTYEPVFRVLAAALLATAGGAGALRAQQGAALPPDSIPLHDLSAFAAPTEGWRVVGSVSADRSRDHRMETDAGTGILANLSRPGEGVDLRTAWEHGDIDLELEFMMPRASNSGIYFQGRYELQLLDSWGVENPTYGDVGGIYQRWDEARGEGREGFEGHAPRLNAARAPGLWQTLRVEFRAPRFDAAGRKIANARFARVVLNDAVIHENIELNAPTRGSDSAEEAPLGPIRIQGDHGPIAFRNIRFKRYGTGALRLSELNYRVYEGEFRSLPEVAALTPVRSGATRDLDARIAGVADAFALVHEGTIDVPAPGDYLLDLSLNWLDEDGGDGSEGGARLLVGGREVLLHPGRDRSVSTRATLQAGRQPFMLELFKHREGRPASFSLVAEGPGVLRQTLTSASSPRRWSAAGAIVVEPAGEPYILRSFLQHEGDKRTHVISVGEPAGVHYSYDAEAAAIVAAWRGPFLETTQMWEERGEPQLAEPLGSVLWLSDAPFVAVLPGSSAAWPDSMPPTSQYRFLGYRMDEERRPTLRYQLGGATVEDRIRPLEGRHGLAREITVAGSPPAGTHVRLAVGESITRQADGSFVVDGDYYIVPGRGSRVSVRTVADGQELVVPLAGAGTVQYELVW